MIKLLPFLETASAQLAPIYTPQAPLTANYTKSRKLNNIMYIVDTNSSKPTLFSPKPYKIKFFLGA